MICCVSGACPVVQVRAPADSITVSAPSRRTGGTGISFNPGYNNSNRYTALPGLSYDANGNLQNDSFHTYAWDPNWGNPSTIDSTTLTYDALGRMVEYQNGTTIKQVMYGPTGKVAIMNGQTEVTSLQPFPAGGVLVHRPGSQTNFWRHTDWLGSSRFASTEPGRGKFFDVGYAPFGEDYGDSGTKDLYFTGQEQDTTTSVGGLYDFSAREYAPRQGRWISPDPAGMKAVDPSNPQSWNRYAYVSDSPLTVTDPSGLCPHCDHDYGHYMAVESTHSMECGFWCTGYNGAGASYTLNGMPVSGQVAQGWLSSDSAAACPSSCSGFSNKGNYVQYVATAGSGAQGYVLFSSLQQGLNDANGIFMTGSEYNAYLRTTYPAQISSQCGTVSGSLSADSGGTAGAAPSVNCGQVKYFQGSHANFPINCGSWNGGDCAGRWPGGLHIESSTLNGQTTYWGHNDTASYYIGNSFNWATFSPWNFLVHSTVDAIYGNTGTYMFSH